MANNDNELEQQNRTLKDLAKNQKQTNKTLVTGFEALQKAGAEDSTFLSKNLGSLMEVAATIDAQQRQMTHEKREGITEVDERVETLTEQNIEESRQSRSLLQVIADAAIGSGGGPGGPGPEPDPESTRRERARETWKRTREAFAPMTSAIKKMTDTFKGGILGFKSKLTIGGLALGAFALAVLAFIDTPWFDKIYDWIVEKILPGLAWIYKELIVPLGQFLWKYLGPLFKDIKEKIDGTGPGSEKSWWDILMDNYGAVIGIAIALGAVGKIIALIGIGISLIAGTWTIIVGAIGLLNPPMLIAIAAIAAIVGLLWFMDGKWEKIVDGLKEMSLIDMVGGLGNAVNVVIAWFLGAILNVGHMMAELVYNAVAGLLPTSLGAPLRKLAAEQRALIGTGQETVLKNLASASDAAGAGGDWLVKSLGLGEATEQLKNISGLSAYESLAEKLGMVTLGMEAIMAGKNEIASGWTKWKNLPLGDAGADILKNIGKAVGIFQKDPLSSDETGAGFAFGSAGPKDLAEALESGRLDVKPLKPKDIRPAPIVEKLKAEKSVILETVEQNKNLLNFLSNMIKGMWRDQPGELAPTGGSTIFNNQQVTNYSSENVPMVSESWYLGSTGSRASMNIGPH